MIKQDITQSRTIELAPNEIAIKGQVDFVNWLVVSAFRYCVNRHETQAMYGVGNVILDNIDVIHTEFIRQFIDDIEQEQRCTEFINDCNEKRSYDCFYGLKGHIGDAQRLLVKDTGENHEKLKTLLKEVMELLPRVDMAHHFGEHKLYSNPDTTYLTPMLERLKAEKEKRNGR